MFNSPIYPAMLKPTEIPPLAPPATKAKTKLDEEDMDDIFASFANVTGETDEIFTPDVVHFGPLTVTSAEKGEQPALVARFEETTA